MTAILGDWFAPFRRRQGRGVWPAAGQLPGRDGLLEKSAGWMITPVLQVVQRVVTGYLFDAAALKADESQGGFLALSQRLGKG